LNEAETRYSTIEKEMLAIIWAVKYFRPYVYGNKFKIITDHKPLVWLQNFKGQSPKLLRWKLTLSEYDYDIVYKIGSQNVIADALSRIEPNTLINDVDPHILDGIPLAKKPLNTFNMQVIFEIGQTSSVAVSRTFKNKNRTHITEPSFTLQKITDILKPILIPNKTLAVHSSK